MNFTIDRVIIHNDWRDWFIIDDIDKKYPFDFFINEDFVDTILLPITEKEIKVEINGNNNSKKHYILNSYSYKCDELDINNRRKFERKFLNQGDTVNIIITLIYDK